MRFQDIIKMIHLIDQNASINNKLTAFPAADITVSIFGTQATGKSTILNFTFNSSFSVLNTSVNRHRCTKGIWLQNTNNINIIDTEGFDSTQRSEDEKTFEKHISLFCVVLSDVILINLFMNEVGRYSGGHLDILDAIFKVGERLVLPQLKKIIFIIRDFEKDANRKIIQEELSKEMAGLIDKYKNKCLKFTIHYYFMSNYLYEHEEFTEQATKLRAMITVKKVSDFNGYSGKDKLIYIKELWTKIRNDHQIDLKSIDDALKNFVFERIKKQCLALLNQQILKTNNLQNAKSYATYIQQLKKSSEDYYLGNRPRHMKMQQVSLHSLKAFNVFEPTAIKYFNDHLLKNIQQQLQLNLQMQIDNNKNSKKLSHLIFKKRKQIVDHYKKIITNHKEYSLLLRYFNQKLAEIIGKEERRLTHLFNLFETAAENQLNNLLSQQISHLVFNQQQINQKIKKICGDYHYNEWEIEFKQIWQRVSYRCMEKLLPQQIQQKSSKCMKDIWFLSLDQSTNIIAYHTKLEKQSLTFCRDILLFMHEQNTFVQPLSQVKDIIRECLRKRLVQEQKRFKLSLTLILLILLLLYGQIQVLLNWMSVKKKERHIWLSIYWYGCLIGFVMASVNKLWFKQKNG